MVALDAVAALGLLVVDLGPGVALRADSSDEVESREAPAGTDGDVPHLIGLASIPADSVGGVVGEEGWAHSAGVSDQVVSLLADAHSVDEVFIGVAGRGAESEVLDVSLVAHAFLGDEVVGGVEGAGGAGSVGQLEELGQALALLGLDVVNSLGVARNPADAQALVIDLVPVALAADAVDGVEASDAAALSVGEDLVGSTAHHAESSLVPVSRGAPTDTSLSTVGSISWALGADTVDAVGLSCAPAGLVDDVEDFIGRAGDPADLEVDVEEGVIGAGDACPIDSVGALPADADLVDEDLVYPALAWEDVGASWAEGGTGGRDAVAAVEGVALDAVAGFGPGVVHCEGTTPSAVSVDVVEP